VDASFSKRRLLANPHKLREVHALLASVGRTYAPKRVLVVVQKAIEEELPKLGKLPPNVELAHHNAVEGRDGWKDVPAQVVVGRTAPSPANVEDLAEALTGSAVLRLDGWYPRACVTREMADGGVLEAEGDRHADAIAEAVRWQICEGQLVQIIGRARGVNRTKADPVKMLVLTDVPLPMPTDRTITAKEIDPSPGDLMLAAGGIAFESSADAAAAYPQLWESARAAEKALERAISGAETDISELVSSYTGLSASAPEIPHLPLRRIRYQKDGQRQRPAVAWADLSVCPDPRARLTELFGELALYDAGGSDARQEDPIDRMIASGRVLFSATDAGAAYREIFATVSAAKEAFAAARQAALPHELLDTIRSRMEEQGLQPVLVSYRPQGRGQQTRQALVARVPPAVVETPS
jgi:putative DNA primase/helicase